MKYRSDQHIKWVVDLGVLGHLFCVASLFGLAHLYNQKKVMQQLRNESCGITVRFKEDVVSLIEGCILNRMLLKGVHFYVHKKLTQHTRVQA